MKGQYLFNKDQYREYSRVSGTIAVQPLFTFHLHESVCPRSVIPLLSTYSMEIKEKKTLDVLYP